jgi:zinc protease
MTITARRFFGCGSLVAAVVLAARADDLATRVREYKLDNGLEVLVYVDTSAPVVSTNVYYRVGSCDEPTGLTGISHMLEHMTFKHTDLYKPGDFDRMVDSAGGGNNGFTSTFYTAYYEDFASDRWDLALKVEASRMARCIFPDSEFESEHQVVAEERRLGDNRPTSIFWEQFDATAFLASPQRNPTIGWPQDVEQFSVQAVRDWYTRHYNPANAVLVVAGDVRPDDVRSRAEKYFGRLKGTPVSRTDFYKTEPRQYGERRMTVRRRVSSPTLCVAWHSPGVRDSNYFVAEAAAALLGDGRSSRLYRRLVTELGICTGAGSYNDAERDPGLLRIYASPKAESLIPRVEAVIDTEVQRMAAELVSERELQKVQNRVLASQMFQRDDVSDMAYLLATYQICTGSWRNFKDYPDHVRSVTREQVRDFCRAALTTDNRTVGMLVAAKEAR